ncbi:MBL fold metallo-hydrolase [Flavobacterium sp. CBA20B-1]|uniref:MBL fold metallo-hydrolase n=2 Tax=unclassified Flavobacterium TaxID=196869 RepID=UPI00234B47EC|nr:MBL fold metallo-hydrolase [Flavobacterium sp. CBA20B-1]WCM41722.1 MBL fold metallo-hydrolase [Flavobacterium sp. CBA20B-1]
MKIKRKKLMTTTLLVIGILIAGTLIFLQHPLFGKQPSGERLKRIQQSKNYTNGQFQNLSNTPALSEDATYFGMIKELLFSKIEHTKPTDSIPCVNTNLLENTINDDFMVWFGHSSYYMKIDGQSLLIDPVLSKNASPLYGTNTAFAGADMFTCEALPKIDVLILTHDHYDHLDYSSFKNIKDKVSKIICPLGVGAHLEYWGFPKENITELDWYEDASLTDSIKITATPARHFSGRSFKRNTTLWASYVLQTKNLNIYLGGDSGYDTHFKEIGTKYGPFDLAILENGQYDRKWKYIHMMPEEVVQASNDLQAKRFFPVHSSKFKLANHPWKEPLERVSIASAKQTASQLITPKIGEVIYLNQQDQVFEKWWEQVN